MKIVSGLRGRKTLLSASITAMIVLVLVLSGPGYSANMAPIGAGIDGGYSYGYLDVTKTVWDPVSEAWVEEINASINQTLRFRCVITSNHSPSGYGYWIEAFDVLSDSLNYSDSATVEGTPCEPSDYGYLKWGYSFSDSCTDPFYSSADGDTITIEFNATAVKCGTDYNNQSARADFYWLGSYYGVIDYAEDFVIVHVACPTGEATDAVGGTKDVYTTRETVYASGSGFMPGDVVDIYVTEDKHWEDGMPINSTIYAGPVTVTVAGNGTITGEEVWPDPVPGEYDMVFDTNQDGSYNTGDVVDNPNDPGFTVVAAVPTVTPMGLIALIGLLSVIVVIRTKLRKRQ